MPRSTRGASSGAYDGYLYMVSNEGYFYIFYPHDMTYASFNVFYTGAGCQGDTYSQGWWGNSNLGKAALYNQSAGWFASVHETYGSVSVQSYLASNGTCQAYSNTISAFKVIPSTATEVGVVETLVAPLSIK